MTTVTEALTQLTSNLHQFVASYMTDMENPPPLQRCVPQSARRRRLQHVHVFSPEGEAKFRLEPSVELAVSKGVSQASLKRMEGIILERKEEIIDAWNRHFPD